MVQRREQQGSVSVGDITLCLCGDVMTGRGIDQVLPHPCAPALYEPYVKDARRYVELAEAVNGPMLKPVPFPYVWGDALEVLERLAPDVRLINLETSVSADGDPWPGKGIHYRMHPANIPCITAAGIDCCSLANNHVLDWGYRGLAQTLTALEEARIGHAGAGLNLSEARAPAVVEVPGKGRVVILAFGTASSGIPDAWAAAPRRAGVNLMHDLTPTSVDRVRDAVQAFKRPGDLVVASIHWGGNWGYDIPCEHRDFARGLIDVAGVDLVHGHSCHHVQGLEVHRGRLILYGCGDFLNDYEGIAGYEAYRPDLSLMYFASLSPADGRLTRMRMVPFRVRRFRANSAFPSEAAWLRDTLNRRGGASAPQVELDEAGVLRIGGRLSDRPPAG